MPPAKVDTDAVRRLWQAGLTDTAIAAALEWDRKTVRRNRRLIGLPPRHSPAALIRRQDVASLLQSRDAAQARKRADLARRYGLPDDLRPAQVEILIALAAGPLTAAQLADRCRRADRPCYKDAFHRFQCPRAAGGNYLTELRRRGLVAYMAINRGRGSGRGRGAGLYLLTAETMRLLTSTQEENRVDAHP